MRTQNYGRIVTTTSPTGLYGNFGQTNYGAAKAGIVGFMRSLTLEGERNNVRVNTICPVAATRMTETIMPPALLQRLSPEFVSPGVLYLASDEAPSGVIMTAAAGVFSIARLYETDGAFLGDHPTPEAVRDSWTKIIDETGQRAYANGGEQVQKFFKHMGAS
jgi:NAD(P)-dependent dehydrogenase (short-subunit alcohol dehydrogenase family)